MKLKYIIYTISLLIFVIYLFSANFIFNVLIKTDKEARLSDISLPSETQNIKCKIEEAKVKELKWKNALFLSGWVFRENVKEERREVYLVLKSKKSTLVFKINKANISRPDIIQSFHMDGRVWGHGFAVYVPVYLLKENNYTIGFVIVDETGTYYSVSLKELKILNGEVSLSG
jgi:hypothetical protein